MRYSGSAQTQKQQLQQLLEEPVDCIVLAAVDALAELYRQYEAVMGKWKIPNLKEAAAR